MPRLEEDVPNTPEIKNEIPLLEHMAFRDQHIQTEVYAAIRSIKSPEVTDEQLWDLLGKTVSNAAETWYDLTDQHIQDALNNMTIPLPQEQSSEDQIVL